MQNSLFTKSAISSADVAGGVRGPRYAIDGCSMIAESGHRETGDTHIQYDHLGRGGGGGGGRTGEGEGEGI